ncbi:hypothetical protein BZG02_16100 [Labilibaculum filiforme]|uniref:NfeD-like C-terminal domain-containing protein n=2 Tax=Labilibaculum filiforme TaxID=1940526 RepID=A0A2N3HTC0_9BACT|nr:hypothetical protein BZG02_16100 [Labilibaculum filiforme]
MILSISNWWSDMNLVEQVFWGIAILFSFFFIIQMILTFFGGDVDDIDVEGDADAAIDSDGGIDFQFLSLKNLIAFFTIFGWTGIICLNSGMGPGISALIATIAGLIMMVIMASIMYFMGKLVEDGTLKMKNAIGKSGSVYLPIPSNRKGMGKVQIQVQGLKILDAVTDQDSEIPTGAIVTVVEIINNQILLVKIN